MKKIPFIVMASILLFISLTNAQIMDENFNYSIGDLVPQSSNWYEGPAGSVDVEVVDGNLSYINYPSSSFGKMIVLNGGVKRSGIYTEFDSISSNGTTLYTSFLINVTSTLDMDSSTSDGGNFCAFADSSIKRSYIYVRQGSSSSTYQIGLAKASSSSLSWYSSELDINNTYLIVIAYVFKVGDDESKLWINPDLSSSEPIADVVVSAGAEATSLFRLQFFQRLDSGDEEIDGVRIATEWAQAPLPVELTSFTAKLTEASVVLNWTTATEVNNYGFSIERKTIIGNRNWEEIGFVEGHGNSYSPKVYSFVDNSTISGNVNYRLKQIDTDGGFKYSNIVTVTAQFVKTELFQNHPNPFNPSTQISFSIANKGRVSVFVYNVLGQKVAKLVDQNMDVGIYNFEFNANNFVSGLYFCRLETPKYSKTMKMMLLR